MSKTPTQVVILWREFLAGVKRRARLLETIRSAALEPLCPSAALKEMMVELRQLTIAMIEDALEIEYRSQFGDSHPPVKGGTSLQLPSIDRFQTLEKKEDILILAGAVTDTDGLFQLNNIAALLPVNFPTTRNPLMLGKSVDDLAHVPIPTPEPGNVEQELKALEFMRYKRAAKALLKAEAQVMNKMPILMEDVERVWLLKDQNSNVNALIRVAVTILDENNHIGSSGSGQLSLLQGGEMSAEPSDFLRGLNKHRSGVQLPADILAAVRLALHKCDLQGIRDPSVEYIAEWVGVVAGTTLVVRRDVPGSPSLRRSRSIGSTNGVSSREGGVVDSRSLSPTEGGGGSLEDSVSKRSVRISSPTASQQKTQVEKSPTKHSRTVPLNRGEQEYKISSTANASDAPPGPIQKSKHKAKAMAEKADITLASAMGAAKKSDSKLKAEIARLKGGAGNAPAVPEQGELNAIRYELLKMQQELLRRKILDPRHYKAASIDSQELLQLNKESNATKSTASSQKQAVKINDVRNKKAAKTSKMAQNIPLAFQSVDWAQHHGVIEVAIEPLTDMIIVKYKEKPPEGVDAAVSDVSASTETEPLTFKVSKLSLNRLIGKQVEFILEANKEVRKKELMPLFEKFMDAMGKYDSNVAKAKSTLTAQSQGVVVSPEMVLDIDRTLCSQELTSGTVAMRVVVSRDLECTGLVITCTPVPGALKLQDNGRFDTGPVTLFLHDKELQVLLINQRGLYNLSQTKWSCMVMVAEWIISRLHARRIPVFHETSILHRIANASRSGRPVSPEISASLLREHFNITDGPDGVPLGEVVPSDQELKLVKEDSEDAKADQEHAQEMGPMLLEVQIDRTVDIADDVVAMWQARNVPNLLGAKYSISARQDLEMLYFKVIVRIPDQETGQRLFNAMAEQKAHIAEVAARKKRGLRIYTLYDEDEEYVEDQDPELEIMTPEQILASNATFTELIFNFALMGVELLIFGSTEILEDLHKTSTMTQKKAFQATKFMRNILGRLFLHFKGLKAANIYSEATNVLDKSQWDMHFDRRLFRDVRTISGGVLIITASVIGGEILFDAQPTEGSIFRQVGSKLFTEDEIRNLVLEEGWPLDSLLPEHRVSLAFRILDSMKVVQAGEFHRLESSSFAESKMITVIRQGTFNKPDVTLGMVEINEHHMLSDLRTIILHELEKSVVPRKFAFNYKGAPCAQRQEQFRKAWECLPKIFLISLVGAPADDIAEIEKQNPKKAEGPIEGANEVKKDGKISQSARTANALIRLNKKLSPVPVPTLCRLFNGSSTVLMLHTMADMGLSPGDVIRFGSAEGSDYVIPMKRSLKKVVLDNKKFDVDPKMNGASSQWLSGNFPKNSNRIKRFHQYLPTLKDMGLEYPPDTDETATTQVEQNGLSAAFAAALTAGTDLSPVKGMPSEEIIKQKEENQRKLTQFTVNEANLDKRDSENPPADKDLTPYNDVWIWKCVPRGEDRRPLFRRKFDAGEIPYEYKHTKDTKSGLTFFRVFICWRDLEIFCTDSRCPSLSCHIQRAEEREKFTADFLVQMAYEKVLQWQNASTTGVEYNKFQKLVSETNIFSDFKKAARLYQLEMLFDREVKGVNGVSNKYVTMDGFYNILQDVAIIRFPSTVGDDEDALFDQPSPPPPMPGQAMNRRKGVLQKGNKYLAHEDLNEVVESSGRGSSKERKRRATSKERGQSRERSQSRDRKGNKGDDDSVASIDSEATSLSEVVNVFGDKPSVVTATTNSDTKNGEDTSNVKTVEFDESSLGSSNTKKSAANRDGSSSPRPSGGSSISPRKKRNSVFSNQNPNAKAMEEYVPVLPRINRTPQEAEHDAQVMLRLLNDYIMNMNDWQSILWETAKNNAMMLEAKRYGACVRIQASCRKKIHWHRFLKYKRAMIKLQAIVRKRIGIRFYNILYRVLTDDWLFRVRYDAAIRIQSIIRRYNVRCSFLKHMKLIKDQEVILLKARRQRFKKLREKEKKGILFQETRRVTGVPLLLVIKRKDQRNYSNNYAIIIEIYLPDSQSTFKFVVEEDELRKYMVEALKVDAVNIADITDRRNLQLVVASRLMLRPSQVKGIPHKVSMSRQALGQRGSKKLTRGIRTAGEYFVCTLFSSGSSYEVACYHRLSSKVFKCSITQVAVTDWVMSEFRPKKRIVDDTELTPSLRKMRGGDKGETVSSDKTSSGGVTVLDLVGTAAGSKVEELPPILKPENAKDLYFWLVSRITVDKRHGQFRVLFKSQMEKSKKANSIVKIQSLWRRAIVRHWIPYKLDTFIVKVQTSLHEPHAYYVNRITGESKWEKSALLKSWDLPTQPLYRWVELWYSHDTPLFVNPLTGRYTHLSVDRASRIIQSVARHWFLKPFSLSQESFAKCADFEKNAKSKYDKAKDKLPCIINYALFLFSLKRDERLSRQLLSTAMEMADTNPVVSRLMGIFILSICEAPIKSTRERATNLLRDGKLRDSEAKKFESARDIFKYACLRRPKDAHVLLNMALVEYYIFENVQSSELLLRRSVSLLPFDERIFENWKNLRDFFPEKKLLYRPKNQIEKLKKSGASDTGKKKTIHGRDCIEDFAWAGWVYAKSGAQVVDSRISNEYWYNPATGEETFDIPNWEDQWNIRLHRSYYESTANGMEHYFDPLTSCYFQRHVLSGTFS